MNNYAVGTQITMQATFKDLLTGNLVDPTTVECVLSLPTREIVQCTTNKISTGIYTAVYALSLIGGHSYKFQGSGNCQVAAFGSFASTGLF